MSRHFLNLLFFSSLLLFFFFNDRPTTEIYTLSLHDALPIYLEVEMAARVASVGPRQALVGHHDAGVHFEIDRKSTRLNSSHTVISYAVFCLKKKKLIDACVALMILGVLVESTPGLRLIKTFR